MASVRPTVCNSGLSFISGITPLRLLVKSRNLSICSQCLRARTTLSTKRIGSASASASSLQPTRAVASETTESKENDGIRVNKCFKSFASRRESDMFVNYGRVMINGNVARPGARVFSGDVVRLDRDIVEWERLTLDIKTDDFLYIKHWKASDIICTTDSRIPNNIIDELSGFSTKVDTDRVYPIGRLDQSSTGIILLTSDGRLPGAVLGANNDSEKKYIVSSDMYVSNDDMEQLRVGVDITTVAQRDRNVRKTFSARTLPCDVERLSGNDLEVTLREGRNRQIRKMMGALGYTTRMIHRTSFMGISLDGLSGPGDSCLLNEHEMGIVNEKLANSNE